MAAQAYIISKLINNNIVFSTDASGDEIILFGKAIGFGKKRGDAVPADQVLRVFRAASGQERKFLTNLVEDIDSVYIDLAGEITALFEQQLQIKVNDILLISLSDHISNAVFNKKEGLDVPLDILPQIIGIYPVEYAIARQGLDLIEERTGVRLSPDEAGYIVLHYINCQGKGYRGDGKYRLLFQEKMVQNVEDYYHVTLNRSSLYYPPLSDPPELSGRTHPRRRTVRQPGFAGVRPADRKISRLAGLHPALRRYHPHKFFGCHQQRRKRLSCPAHRQYAAGHS